MCCSTFGLSRCQPRPERTGFGKDSTSKHKSVWVVTGQTISCWRSSRVFNQVPHYAEFANGWRLAQARPYWVQRIHAQSTRHGPELGIESQAVRRRWVGNAAPLDGAFENALERGLMQMVSALSSSFRFKIPARCRKHPLPSPGPHSDTSGRAHPAKTTRPALSLRSLSCSR